MKRPGRPQRGAKTETYRSLDRQGMPIVAYAPNWRERWQSGEWIKR